MIVTCVAFWIGVNLVLQAIAETKEVIYNVTYFSTGEEVTLKCNCKVAFWNGPVVTNAVNKTSSVEIIDIYGKPKVWNVGIYTYGGKVAPMLPPKLFKRLNVIGDNFDLHVTNLSTTDEGLYICDLRQYCVKLQSSYLLQKKLFPSKLKIPNLTRNNTVIGKENCRLNLVCLVESGKPPEVIRWRKNGIILSQGGPSKLVYSFVPMKKDHQSMFTCEARNTDMTKPLTKSIHLNIKYKPSIRINVSSTLNVIEGEKAHICCTSWGNPKPTVIFWHKGDKELVSAFNNSSLCYKISNVSRHDTGTYVCSSKNEIDDAFSEILLNILYPPIINLRYTNLTEYRSNIEIRCLAQGEPNIYKYFKWEHQSFFNEHIRYLDGTDDGILRLPEVNISNIYQDTGFYTCNVSNGIPDYDGNMFQQGRAYYHVSIGPPVFVADNKRIQYSAIVAAVEIKVRVYSSSAITCQNITVGSMLVRLQDMEVRIEHILIKESFHNAMVTVNGFEIIFTLNGLNFCRSLEFNVTVCNSYGQSSSVVALKTFVISSDQNALSFQRIINIVLFIIILFLITGIGVYVRYTRNRYRKRLITEVNIQTAERNPHYEDIFEEDIMITAPQETDRIAAGNSNTMAMSDDYSSSSSNTDNNASEDLNDGYEKPYATLVSNNGDEVEHVYRKTKQTLTYENSPGSTNATLKHSVELHGFSLDITKINGISIEDRENTDMRYEENDPQEIDDVSNHSNAYKQKETVEYINLSLKQ